MIAVKKSVRQDYLAHHVRSCYSDIRNSYELYSRELLQTLRQTNTELSNNRSYRIYGAINKNEGLASFSMQECILGMSLSEWEKQYERQSDTTI